MWKRTTVAFLVAPAIGAFAASLLVAAVWPAFFFLGFFVSTLVVAYAATAVIGVPWFLVWPGSPTSIGGYTLAALLVACTPALLMLLFLPPLFALLSVITGAIAGATFGVIVLPTSNNRWRGP